MTAPRFHDPDITDSVTAELAQRAPASPQPPQPPPPHPRRVGKHTMREYLHDPARSIMGVVGPDVAKLTGVPVGTVFRVLLELEAAGKVKRTGERRAGWDGDLYDVWDKVR